MKRRTFIRESAFLTAGAVMIPASKWLFAQPVSATFPQAVVVKNGQPSQLLKAALHALGGMERFVKAGDVVVVKPNIGWDRPPELAANTNPLLVEAIVKACFKAGAKQVKVFDRTCNDPRRCYRNSKIAERARAAGADVMHVRRNRFTTLAINGQLIKEWPIYEDYLKADKVINVPIAKQHSLSTVTLGLKNLMGVMGGNRGNIHNHFARKLTEIDGRILPTLTIIDAYRILTANGPQGGSPDYVKIKRTLIASDCTVSADYLALPLFGYHLEQVEHIKVAAQKGLARYDLKKLKVKEINLA